VIMAMTLSPAGLAKIAHSEGFQAEAYPDHKGQSIGYGHPVQPGESFPGPITEEQARDLLKEDAAAAEADVNDLIRAPLTQEQFDALVDFRYNLGIVPLTKVAVTLNTYGLQAAAAHIKLYDRMHGPNGELVVSPGLMARRAEEAKAFEQPAPA
jgi:lysozyme